MNISDLNLEPVAEAGAVALQKAHPDVAFTSGRRGVAEQAAAMASNIIHNRRWIARTYVNTAESRQLQAWVNAHPSATLQGAIAAGLATIMSTWTDAQKDKLSKHFSGKAFDVQPVPGPAGEAILATMRALVARSPGAKLLTEEGGLVRWHVQYA